MPVAKAGIIAGTRGETSLSNRVGSKKNSVIRLLLQNFLRLRFIGEALVVDLHSVKEPLRVAM
jgi:hypothetical protein